MLVFIIGMKMEMSDITFWNVVCKLLFHVFFKPLQLSGREVLHCKTIMLLVVRDMSTANHMPLSETYPAPLHFKHAPVFVFYSIQVSTNIPSYNIPIRILINGRSYLTLIQNSLSNVTSSHLSIIPDTLFDSSDMSQVHIDMKRV